MAGLRKVVCLSSRAASLTLRRQLSVSSRVNTLVAVNPVPHIRPETSGLEALKGKELGPWAELSKEDKVELYRAQFPLTMAEQAADTGPSGQKVFGMVLSICAAAVVYFIFLRKYVGPEAPRSLTDEWRDDSIEKMKKQRTNPILGLSAGK